jgi:hypothetical protein
MLCACSSVLSVSLDMRPLELVSESSGGPVRPFDADARDGFAVIAWDESRSVQVLCPVVSPSMCPTNASEALPNRQVTMLSISSEARGVKELKIRHWNVTARVKRTQRKWEQNDGRSN